jgi:hypothetical protein
VKLVIAGSRSIKDYHITRQAFLESGLWDKYKKKLEIISGEAEGPDKHGEIIAEKAGLKLHRKPADWGNVKAKGAVIRHNSRGAYNALAGHWRNEEMAHMADCALIVWDGKSTGSLDMLHRMIALEKRAILYPLRISADALDSLQDKCEIIFPNQLTST